MNKTLVISFSGGETSAFMTRKLLSGWRGRYERVLVCFANTGEEAEQTLDFVHRCDVEFGFGVVWLEALVHPEKGFGTRHRVVDYGSASRRGEPFEAFAKKYGLPGPAFPQCSKELKYRPIKSWLQSLGLAPGTYDEAIGIRADEAHRVRRDKSRALVYPLVSEWPTTKIDVNRYWAKQPFRLQLTGYQGNCKWCWKKTLRKHLTIMKETPEWFDFPERLEKQYDRVNVADDALPRRMFRKERTVLDLRALAQGEFMLYDDEHQYGLDDGAEDGCQEACEAIFGDDDEATGV